jgi:hypothetical protein
MSRLGPTAYSDTMTALMKLLHSPAGSMSAVAAVMPQIVNQVSLPSVLAIDRVVKVAQSLVGGLITDARMGRPLHMADTLAAGIGDIVSVAQQTFLDPNTSITAGVLNARDVITFAISNAQPSLAAATTPMSTPSAPKAQSASLSAANTSTQNPPMPTSPGETGASRRVTRTNAALTNTSARSAHSVASDGTTNTSNAHKGNSNRSSSTKSPRAAH